MARGSWWIDFGPGTLSKDRARLALWAKEIAPSTELRKWYSHDPKKWEEFKSRYFRELLTYIKKGRVTLFYSST